MSEIDDTFVSVGDGNDGSRKKTINPRKREVEKRKRLSQPKGYNTFSSCLHSSSRFSCKSFTPNDCSFVRSKLFSVPDKVAQDNFISSLVSLKPVKRRRPRPKSNKQRPNSCSVEYTLIKRDKQIVHVCKKFFMSIMLVKPTRLRSIVSAIRNGEHITEKRGGDRKSAKSAGKKELVRNFIKQLRGKETHYSRKKSKRIYLDANVNITKLWKMYNSTQDETDNKVSKTMFRRIFHTFNVGFRSPASDVCSYCYKMKHLIKTTTDPVKKTEYMTSKRVHSLRAAAFYKLMKTEVPDSKTLCFDLQQIQPLPKSPIQEAYYSRQIGLYCLCIVGIDGKNPSFYLWTEDQAGKGSIEVSSALLQHLESLELPNNITTIRLFCDGCGAQNKNNFVLHTLMHFLLKTKSKVETIQITFPVRGHSFLPADRVFGQVEKLLRKQPTIIHKANYIDVYKSVGVVKMVGEDWKIYDTKSLSSKEQGCFKRLVGISDCKRIAIKKEVINRKKRLRVKALLNFVFESEAEPWQSLQKKGWTTKRCSTVELEELPIIHNISSAKKKDVDKLLQNIFGEDWKSDNGLEWYLRIVSNQAHANEDDGENNIPDEECICLDDDTGLHV